MEISRAMETVPYLTEEWEKKQIWELFEEQKKGKNLFVFGTGRGLDYFFRNCCEHMEIKGFLDNNKTKCGKTLGWYCPEAWRTEYEDMLIQAPEVLKKYTAQDVIVLITVMNGYDEMIEQMSQMGISNCYVMRVLEANKRKKVISDKLEDTAKIRDTYRDWCCQQKIDRNKIVMHIGDYGGHARQITRQLLKKRRDLDIVWLVDDSCTDTPETVRLIFKKNWKRYVYEAETAKIWLFDSPTPGLLYKRPEQIYIQVKHWSSITLKKFGLDDKNCCTSPQIEEIIKYDGRKIDYLFTGSEFDEMSCRSGFAFKGQAIRIGSARSDILFDPAARKKVLERFQLDEKVRILLYAPTFRYKDYYAHSGMEISLDLVSLLEKVSDKWGGEWYILVRLHPLMDFAKSGLRESGYILNAGNYPDSGELVAAADIMITDYSSIMFEGAFIKQPIFLYAPDYQEFIAQDRDFWIDYNTLPFPRAESNEELHRCIAEFDRQKYEQEVTDFLNQYGVHEDGHASERAAEFIVGLL